MKCSVTIDPPEVEKSRGCRCIDSVEEQKANAKVSIFDGIAPAKVVSTSQPFGSTGVVSFGLVDDEGKLSSCTQEHKLILPFSKPTAIRPREEDEELAGTGRKAIEVTADGDQSTKRTRCKASEGCSSKPSGSSSRSIADILQSGSKQQAAKERARQPSQNQSKISKKLLNVITFRESESDLDA